MPYGDLALDAEATTAKQRAADHDRLFCIFGILAAILLVVLWPGDVAWVSDEPLLIHNALDANGFRLPASLGLVGTQGVHYGPLPTWIYQAYLLVSHDVITLAALRGAAIVLIVGISLLRIARLTGLNSRAIPVFLLCPYLWLYSRLIWDNSFNIVFSVLAVVSYLEFLRGRRSAIIVAIASCGAMLLTHLMAVPLVAAIALHAATIGARQLWKARAHVTLAILIVIATSLRYLASLLPELRQTGHKSLPSYADAIFSLSGGAWFSLSGWADILGDDWWSGASPLLRGLSYVTLISHAFVLVGLVIAMRTIRHRLTAQGSAARQAIPFICTATLLFQFLYYGANSVGGMVHYYNASWFAYAGLIWLALDRVSELRGLRHISVAWATMLLVGTATIALEVHRTGGSRAYGPTLANQMELARALSMLDGRCKVTSDVEGVDPRSSRLVTLKMLIEQEAGGSDGPSATARIQYRSDDRRSGQILLVPDPQGIP